jgi:D-glycerate 3-kinase
MSADDASTRVMALCRPRIARTHRPWLLALAGLPGCGKSTLARALVGQAQRLGWPALALSLDDFYLPRRARRQLAAYIHPLLLTRGVPGTHDLALLRHVLGRLPDASPARPVAIPRFDKGRDTRQPPSRWPRIGSPPRLVILEGWCLGIAPQADPALRRPINRLEREEDADGRWRTRVDRHLPDYLALWRGADARVHLRLANWPAVKHAREQAEQILHERGAPEAMDTAALARFLQHYERLGRHALAHPPTDCDLVLRARVR